MNVNEVDQTEQDTPSALSTTAASSSTIAKPIEEVLKRRERKDQKRKKYYEYQVQRTGETESEYIHSYLLLTTF